MPKKYEWKKVSEFEGEEKVKEVRWGTELREKAVIVGRECSREIVLMGFYTRYIERAACQWLSGKGFLPLGCRTCRASRSEPADASWRLFSSSSLRCVTLFSARRDQRLSL